jgi:hypothetical protein
MVRRAATTGQLVKGRGKPQAGQGRWEEWEE